MQHGDIDKTKVLKTQRDSMSVVRKPNFKSVLKSVIPVRPVLNTGQTGLTYPRASPVHRTCPVPLPASRAVCRTCMVLDETSLANNMTVGIWASPDKSGHNRTCPAPNPNLPIQRVSFREWHDPSWGHPTGLIGMMDRSDRSGLTPPTASFLDSL
jgi:hypothetical protein